MIQHNFIDELINQFDTTLRVISGTQTHSHRKHPAENIKDDITLTQQEKKHSARLMRINHSGEIAAQGLYHGQALSTFNKNTKNIMLENAHEESDHLEWCRNRIEQLGGRVSILSPVWYFGSVALGAIAGLFGDKVSYAFVNETEEQVVNHLQSHLDELSSKDKVTHAIIEQIQIDEKEHAENAKQASDYQLPKSIKILMQHSARIMTTSTRWI